MNREKLAWMLSILLIAILAFHLPGSFAQRDDDYAFVRTLVDIHRQIVRNYVEPVEENKLDQGAIDGMMGQLDPFSMYVPPDEQEKFDNMLEGSFKGVGIRLNPREDGQVEVLTPIDGSPALRAGVLAGDIILKVNGEPVTGLKLDEVIKKISGPMGTSVTLTVRHVTGKVEDLTMPRAEVVIPTVEGFLRKPDNTWDYYVSTEPKVAYVRVTQFTSDTADKVREVIEPLLADGMKGLILDLRFNPGGRLEEAVKMCSLFMRQGKIVTTRGRNRPEETKYASGQGTLPDFPLIVLVNDHSASAAEIVAGALKDNGRALVMGQRTYGKGSVQEVIPLEGDSGELKLTVAYWYLPSGRLVHRVKGAKDWGVEPQIVIPVDQDTERRILEDRNDQQIFHRPTTRPVTQAATQPGDAESTATETPTVVTTQPVDPQLQQAATTMIGWIVLSHGSSNVPAAMEQAATSQTADIESPPSVDQPATQPVSVP